MGSELGRPRSGFVSLYIHWPYCLSKCPYCDFNSHVAAKIDYEVWAKAYADELTYFARLVAGRSLGSIYFGGGTPSLMPIHLVEHILTTVYKVFQVNPTIEITLEANPTSVEFEKFKDLGSAGINRVSIGVQSLDGDSLKFLGRQHTADEALKAIEWADKSFKRYSFDLIYARPSQTLEAWDRELDQALSLVKDHLSLYQLTIEPGTPFYTAYQRGEFVLPDEDLSEKLYDLTGDRLKTKGLQGYEISNYALSGFESQHNLTYWRYGDYIGVGPGAHGRLTLDGHKYATRTHRAPSIWLERVKKLGTGLEEQTRLSEDEQLREQLLMGLRLREGIDLRDLPKNFWESIGEYKKKTLEETGDLSSNKNRLALTVQGQKRLNTILAYMGV